jgi:hypothetical protein
MRWAALVLAILINIGVLAWVAMPMLVIYAEFPPREVTCESCASPDVQQALARAASVGRTQVLRQFDRVFPVLAALSIFNVALLATVLALSRRRNAA